MLLLLCFAAEHSRAQNSSSDPDKDVLAKDAKQDDAKTGEQRITISDQHRGFEAASLATKSSTTRPTKISKLEDSDAPILRAQILEVKAEPFGFQQIYRLKLKLEFANHGTGPLILLHGSYGNGKPWWVLDVTLSRSNPDGTPGALVYGSPLGPANSQSSPWWEELRKNLMKATPPPSFTQVLSPGDTYVDYVDTVVVLPNSGFSLSNLTMQVFLELWPDNIDGFETSKNSFGNRLSKKWRRIGTLWREPVASDPPDFNKPQVINDLELQQDIKEFAAGSWEADAAWKRLEAYPRANLISRLTTMQTSTPTDDAQYISVAFVLCNLKHDEMANKSIILSAFIKEPHDKNPDADWESQLLHRLLLNGHKDLLPVLLGAAIWSDGGLSSSLGDTYAEQAVAHPEEFLYALKDVDSSTRPTVYLLLRDHIESKDLGNLKTFLTKVTADKPTKRVAEEMYLALNQEGN